jgi:hypothetical protein
MKRYDFCLFLHNDGISVDPYFPCLVNSYEDWFMGIEYLEEGIVGVYYE